MLLSNIIALYYSKSSGNGRSNPTVFLYISGQAMSAFFDMLCMRLPTKKGGFYGRCRGRSREARATYSYVGT